MLHLECGTKVAGSVSRSGKQRKSSSNDWPFSPTSLSSGHKEVVKSNQNIPKRHKERRFCCISARGPLITWLIDRGQDQESASMAKRAIQANFLQNFNRSVAECPSKVELNRAHNPKNINISGIIYTALRWSRCARAGPLFSLSLSACIPARDALSIRLCLLQ